MPQDVQWLSADACCIFHTVNTWDGPTEINNLYPDVSILVCRLTGPSIMFEAADIPVPSDQAVQQDECTLYYYKFSARGKERYISQEWALSAIPFEFPHVPKHLAMSCTNFVYGCSVGNGDSTHQRGKSFKIGSLVKANVHSLITRGIANPPVSGYVDGRTVGEILASHDPEDTIQIFPMPSGWYAQECTFVPRKGGISEDDGWLLTFTFDESQLDAFGNAPDNARSELWIIDAKSMKEVVMRVRIPQRVPYGLHGNWFTEDEIMNQRPIKTHRG
jgi:carotenoid cleavage dioxygenase-like enzyme